MASTNDPPLSTRAVLPMNQTGVLPASAYGIVVAEENRAAPVCVADELHRLQSMLDLGRSEEQVPIPVPSEALVQFANEIQNGFGALISKAQSRPADGSFCPEKIKVEVQLPPSCVPNTDAATAVAGIERALSAEASRYATTVQTVVTSVLREVGQKVFDVVTTVQHLERGFAARVEQICEQSRSLHFNESAAEESAESVQVLLRLAQKYADFLRQIATDYDLQCLEQNVRLADALSTYSDGCYVIVDALFSNGSDALACLRANVPASVRLLEAEPRLLEWQNLFADLRCTANDKTAAELQLRADALHRRDLVRRAAKTTRKKERERLEVARLSVTVQAARLIGQKLRQAVTVLVGEQDRFAESVSKTCTALNQLQVRALQGNVDTFAELATCLQACTTMHGEVERTVREAVYGTVSATLAALGLPKLGAENRTAHTEGEGIPEKSVDDSESDEEDVEEEEDESNE